MKTEQSFLKCLVYRLCEPPSEYYLRQDKINLESKQPEEQEHYPGQWPDNLCFGYVFKYLWEYNYLELSKTLIFA